MEKSLISVVIFLPEYIVYGMVKHFSGSSLDSLLEKERDDFLEVKNARIFLASDARELYSLSLLEVNKSQVTMIFSEDAVIKRAR